MRGVSSCLFRRFTQDKSILFQEGARVSVYCELETREACQTKVDENRSRAF